MVLNVIFGTKQQKILVIIIKNVFFCIKPQEEDQEKMACFSHGSTGMGGAKT